MAEGTPNDDQKFWIFQNRMLGVWAAMACAVFAAGLFALLEKNYLAGVPLSVGGVAALFWVDNRMSQPHTELTAASLTKQHYRWFVILTVLTWLFLGYDIYDRYHPSDPREIATHEQIRGFVEEMKNSPDPGVAHFSTVCVSDESCAILVKYRDELSSAGWTLGAIYRLANNGVYVVTTSDTDHPPQVAALRRALTNAGVEVGWYNFTGAAFPQPKSGDFELVVGPLK